LLRYVAGINERTARKIVEFRNENGRFRSRVALSAISGVGPKTFEQAAGFLRIRGGDNPLDMTAVHPESYSIVKQIVTSLGVSMERLIQDPELLENFDKSALTAGAYTLNDILEELRKPGRDPRDQFVAPAFQEGVKEISDLQPGMKLEGVVTNVTKFGAFVDIGVHQDGLVHVSELANRYVRDPSEVVKAGQIVKVQVLNADPKTRRISLSIKALLPAPPPVHNQKGEQPGNRQRK
jgi:protein Tex